MGERNKHGLGRTIPSDIKREVRKRCGFGCVRCGLALYDYEHFSPDFKDATKHSAAGITLLCMQCNQKRNRGVLSVETVQLANEQPKCLSNGFAKEMWDLGVEQFEVVISGVSFFGCETLIEINKFPILTIQPPEELGQPYRLSGRFSDSSGEITLTIKDNVWFAGADNWDVECNDPRITIRNGPGNISLILKSEPPHRLIVERINMQFEGAMLRGDTEKLELSTNGKDWNSLHQVTMRNCSIGISINNR